MCVKFTLNFTKVGNLTSLLCNFFIQKYDLLKIEYTVFGKDNLKRVIYTVERIYQMLESKM